MSLSRREKRALAAMERALTREPILVELCDMFVDSAPPPPRRRWRGPWLALVLVTVTGVVCAVTGGIAGLTALTAIGIAVATCAGMLLIPRPRNATVGGATPKPVAG